MVDHAYDPVSDMYHIFFFESSGSEGGSAKAKAGGVVGRAGFAGYGVFVGSHVGEIQRIFELAPETTAGREVEEQEMVITATRDHADPRFFKL